MEARHPVILLVDDQAEELNSLSVLLSECGYRVLAETEVQAACDFLRKGVSVDLLLSTMHLGGNGAGYGVLEMWRRQRATTPVVAITPEKDVESAVKAMRLGASDCITQPVDPQVVLATLDRLAAASSSGLSPTRRDNSLMSNRKKPSEGVASPNSAVLPKDTPSEQRSDLPLDGLTIAELERLAITQTLQKCNGNRTMAARRLGISVRTLQRKLRKWDRDENAPRSARPVMTDVGDVPAPLSPLPFSAVY